MNFNFFFNGHIHTIWKFPVQWLNLHCSCYLYHNCGNTRSLIQHTRLGIKPASPQRPHWILYPLCHRDNSWTLLFLREEFFVSISSIDVNLSYNFQVSIWVTLGICSHKITNNILLHLIWFIIFLLLYICRSKSLHFYTLKLYIYNYTF